MAPLVRAHPQDAEILFLAGLSAIYAGDLSGAIALFDRALAIDPTYGAALYLRAESIAYEGDFANARRSFAECIARAPLAESCLRWQPLLDDQEGDLAACERDARALRALGPGTVTTQRIYAEALLARGDTIESVLEVLAKEWSVTPEAERALREQRDRAALDAYQGHLDDAIKRLDRNLDAIIASSDPWRWRQDVALYLSLLEETGRAKEGGARAAKVRRRLPALDANAHGDDWSIAQDALPILVRRGVCRRRAHARRARRPPRGMDPLVERAGLRSVACVPVGLRVGRAHPHAGGRCGSAERSGARCTAVPPAHRDELRARTDVPLGRRPHPRDSAPAERRELVHRPVVPGSSRPSARPACRRDRC